MPSSKGLSIQEKLAAQYLALGMSLEEVSTAISMPLPKLTRLMKHPHFIYEVEQSRTRAFPLLADRLTQRLESLQVPALEKMAALMGAESEPVQFQAAKSLLDRGPLAPKPTHPGRELPGQGVTITLDQQALQAILGGAMNMGLSSVVAAFASLESLPMPTFIPSRPDGMDLIEGMEEEG